MVSFSHRVDFRFESFRPSPLPHKYCSVKKRARITHFKLRLNPQIKYMTFMYQPHISHALITSGLDYCNKVLHSLAAYQVKKVQRVQNSAARLIYRLSKYCQVTSFCKNAHLLPVYSRTQFKIFVITYVEFQEPHGLVCSSRTAKHSYSILKFRIEWSRKLEEIVH